MGKLGVLVAAGAGYVLGTRAGRERYEQIKSGAQRVWRSDRVQSTVSSAGDVAKEKTAEAAGFVKDTVKDKVAGSDVGDAHEQQPTDPNLGHA